MLFPNPFARWRRPAPAPVAAPARVSLGPPSELRFESAAMPARTIAGRRSGPALDYTARLAAVSADIAVRVPTFAHLRLPEMLFTATPARRQGVYGLQARLTPMRFAGGATYTRRRGRVYQAQRFTLDGRDVLYVVTVCVPRFLDQPFDEKLVTLFHELYHVGPAFDGDLRRHAGRCHVHTHSQKAYDRAMGRLVAGYLTTGPDPELLAFLRPSAAGLAAAYGRVTAAAVPRPKMLPVRG